MCNRILLLFWKLLQWNLHANWTIFERGRGRGSVDTLEQVKINSGCLKSLQRRYSIQFTDFKKHYEWLYSKSINSFKITFRPNGRKLLTVNEFGVLTLYAWAPQNDQTHANNSSAIADDLFERVWPLCGVST